MLTKRLIRILDEHLAPILAALHHYLLVLIFLQRPSILTSQTPQGSATCMTNLDLGADPRKD